MENNRVVLFFNIAGVAQMAERLPSKQKVADSNSVSRSKKNSKNCECSSVVRMSPCQGEGRGFDSHHSLKQICPGSSTEQNAGLRNR